MQEHRLKLLLIQGFGDCFHGYFLLLCKNSSSSYSLVLPKGWVLFLRNNPAQSLCTLFTGAFFFFTAHSIFKLAGNLSFLHKLLLKVCIVHLFRSHKMFMSKGTEWWNQHFSGRMKTQVPDRVTWLSENHNIYYVF